MNHDQIAGNWKQFRGKVQEQWGRLTRVDLDVLEGRREQLLGRIQHLRGMVRGASDKQLLRWAQRNAYTRL